MVNAQSINQVLVVLQVVPFYTTLFSDESRGLYMLEKVNLKHELKLFDEYWQPKIIGELNGFHVKLAKFKGEFIWHKHDLEDELFLVISGRLAIELRDQMIHLGEGELLIIPKGVEHRPMAEQEAHVLLLERASILNTGDMVANELTHAALDII